MCKCASFTFVINNERIHILYGFAADTQAHTQTPKARGIILCVVWLDQNTYWKLDGFGAHKRIFRDQASRGRL